MERITYLCNTTPNLDKLQRNLPHILPYVEGAVICIGERNAEAEAYCKSFDKVKLVHFPWNDSFREAYQTCFDHAPREGWHLRMDDDEVPSLEMLGQLRDLIFSTDRGTFTDVFSFRCTNVIDETEEPTNYYREMLYRWSPSLRYEVDLHQSLVGLRGPCARSEATYYHHKTTIGVLRASARDFFISGSWADSIEGFTYWHRETGQDPRINPNAPKIPNREGIPFPLRVGFLIDVWYEMKNILARNHPEVKYFRDLEKLVTENKICPEFRDWAEAHNSENDKRPHLHELHCIDKWLKMEKR